MYPVTVLSRLGSGTGNILSVFPAKSVVIMLQAGARQEFSLGVALREGALKKKTRKNGFGSLFCIEWPHTATKTRTSEGCKKSRRAHSNTKEVALTGRIQALRGTRLMHLNCNRH